ncbi:unnamed protein product [Lampetra planeri]
MCQARLVPRCRCPRRDAGAVVTETRHAFERGSERELCPCAHSDYFGTRELSVSVVQCRRFAPDENHEVDFSPRRRWEAPEGGQKERARTPCLPLHASSLPSCLSRSQLEPAGVRLPIPAG